MKRSLVALITAATVLTIAPTAHAGSAAEAARRRIANRLGDQTRLSTGARLWLNGIDAPQEGDPGAPRIAFGTNVDAADPSEDLLAGQAETAIGATGHRVLASWNDITGFAFNDSTDRRASITGVGYSSDGGAHFNDLVGLPNPNPDQQWFGDPTVVSIDDRHFAVGGLYFPSFFTACSDGNPAGLDLAISVGTVSADGTRVAFSDPIVTADGGNACERPTRDSAFLDKPFLSYDRTSRTLAMSYTSFLANRHRSGLGEIDVVRAHVPAAPAALTTASFGSPITVWHEEPFCFTGSEANQCGAVNTGSYPAVAPNGDIYVAWERNVDSNYQFSGDPYVYIHAALIPTGNDHVAIGGKGRPIVVTEGQVNSNPDGGVKSLDGTVIAGFSRGTGQDFPRVAFDRPLNRLVVEWNDASLHPLGDIWMRSMGAGLRHPSAIARVNDDHSYALHFLPAVSVRSDGTICSSWYDRRIGGADSTQTDTFGECRSGPRASATDFRISTGSSDWAATSSFINPNFGDYTDNTSTGTKTYFVWSDGRIGVPQPFVDSRG
jgi:hypothetical protein